MAPTKGAASTVKNEASDDNKLKCRVMLKDIMLSKKLLLDVSNRFNLNSISLSDEKKFILSADQEGEVEVASNREEQATPSGDAAGLTTSNDANSNQDVSMNETQS